MRRRSATGPAGSKTSPRPGSAMTLASAYSGMSRVDGARATLRSSCAYQIIEDDLEPGLGIGRNNLVHEGQELLAAPALLVRARDLARRHLERGDQGRGAVPLIVVAVSRQRASVRQLQIALRALQRLDRRFLVDTYDDGIVGRR